MTGNEIAFTITLRIGAILLIIALLSLLLERVALIRPTVRRLAWVMFFMVVGLGAAAGLYLAPAPGGFSASMDPEVITRLNLMCLILSTIGIVLSLRDIGKK